MKVKVVNERKRDVRNRDHHGMLKASGLGRESRPCAARTLLCKFIYTQKRDAAPPITALLLISSRYKEKIRGKITVWGEKPAKAFQLLFVQ
jgi:hypothetical protein